MYNFIHHHTYYFQDVVDNVEYLDSLGKTQTANVKRDAEIGVAEANRDAGIRVGGQWASEEIIVLSRVGLVQ